MEVDTVTTAPESTKKPRDPLIKHWAGCTLNNPTAADEACWLAKIAPIADYYVYGKEVGASGTPHFQFMVSFKTQKRLSQVTKLFPTKAHWEPKSVHSTMLQASDYCKKGGSFIEYGSLPLDKTVAGRKVIADNYADTIQRAKVGDLDNIQPSHLLKYYGTIKKIEDSEKNKIRVKPDNWLRISEGGKPKDLPHKWFYGPTGMRSK